MKENDLGKQLWKKIEAPQGYAYLSDAVEDMLDEKVIEMVEASLRWHKESARVLCEILEGHIRRRAGDLGCTCGFTIMNYEVVRISNIFCKAKHKSLGV